MLNIKPILNNNAFIIDGIDKYYLFFPFNRTFSVLNPDMLHLLQRCDGNSSIRDILNEYEFTSDVSSLFQTLLDREILVDSSHNKIIVADSSEEKEAEFGWRLTSP